MKNGAYGAELIPVFSVWMTVSMHLHGRNLTKFIGNLGYRVGE